MKPLEWFTERVGTIVYRNKSLCGCEICTHKLEDGVVIGDKYTAKYMHMIQEEGVVYLDTNEYSLRDFQEGMPSQTIRFFENNEDGTIKSGTTLEEMLRVSIARLRDLNNRFSCRENSIALTNMEQALMWLNERTRERTARGVEGTHQK